MEALDPGTIFNLLNLQGIHPNSPKSHASFGTSALNKVTTDAG